MDQDCGLVMGLITDITIPKKQFCILECYKNGEYRIDHLYLTMADILILTNELNQNQIEFKLYLGNEMNRGEPDNLDELFK